MTFLLSLLLHLAPVMPADSTENALLWKISGRDLAAPSYLYGTIHATCARDLHVTDAMQAALHQTEQLALELDMDDPGMVLTMQQHLFMPDDLTLKTLLSPEDYQLVDHFFSDSLGMALNKVQRMKPFMLYSLMFGKLLGCTPESYEVELMMRAKEAKKEVVGLETAEYQLSLFDKMPYDKQAAQLVEDIQDIGRTRKEFADMQRYYQEENLRPVYEMMLETSPGYADFEEVFLIERNHHWVDTMAAMMPQTPTFFAVGALHLVGNDGLIHLLRQAGYTVEPVRTEE
ncbi:hypothetical protein SAMN05421823_1014 [Catalinimonas alkaloidigena]|uniref:TraB family protein n=1 Tax=Catalinimonas alkaloidigena TaxID=1075417 RepID=A0A1G8W8W6_9BACT|nr:TraB/GumN family protein [Catalinimonas alkaloidigena]SDJ74749.1 hypothetical protein SAMN05421823_1014 [Catalinimonas alkaloidigena]